MSIDYYRDARVRVRIAEFLGGTPVEDASCVFINANDSAGIPGFAPLDPVELDRSFDEGKEIARSLWDRQHLLAHLDVEYVNFDLPGHPYQRFQEAFELQRPACAAIEKVLRRFGIRPLHVLSGRGHHFVWQVKQDSDVLVELGRLGCVPPSLLGRYAEPLPPRGEIIGPPLARAFAGLGLLMEHLTHEVLRVASRDSTVPLTLTAVETISRRGHRESVSLDLSEYGDPLHTRAVRVPFSIYYKPLQQEGLMGREIARKLPSMFLVPLHGMDEHHALLVMRDARLVRKLASTSRAMIPENNQGTLRLLRHYRRSRLARVHRWFYAQDHDAPEAWSRTYDATALDMLPPSARKILSEPNDLLMKPACLRHLVRLFMALGWHPRHIAGLVRSKFERDHGWGHEWYVYDASTRADFYCRVFTGLILRGLDDFSDFCCPPVSPLMPLARGWNEDFEPYKRSLIRRMEYDRLASRPFHRLFL